MKTLFIIDIFDSIKNIYFYFNELKKLFVDEFYEKNRDIIYWNEKYTDFQEQIKVEKTNSSQIAIIIKIEEYYRKHLLIKIVGKVKSEIIKKSTEILKENNIKFQFLQHL